MASINYLYGNCFGDCDYQSVNETKGWEHC